jgi:Fur family transcriptional regulator, zinc uptake regulator
MTSCNDHNKCTQDAFKTAQEICIKQDLRFTDLRQKVFSIILQNHQSSKAYDILNILQKEDSSAKPATVYRTLDFLLEYGLIHKLHISNSYVTCSHPLKHKRCSFLICSKCGDVRECCDQDLINQLEKIGSKNDFKIEDATVEIRGICNVCVA